MVHHAPSLSVRQPRHRLLCTRFRCGKQPEAPGRFRRICPTRFAVLSRLAIDHAYQGRGVGRALVRDAGLRLLNAAEILGIRCVLVHAISNDARAL